MQLNCNLDFTVTECTKIPRFVGPKSVKIFYESRQMFKNRQRTSPKIFKIEYNFKQAYLNILAVEISTISK